MASIGTLRDKEIPKGDTFSESMNFYTLENDVRVPLNLTDYDDIRMDVRDNPYESATKFIGVSLGNGISISGDDNNTLIITLSKEDTKKLLTNYNQFSVNTASSTNTLQKLSRVENFYFRDIRFIVGDSVTTQLNGRYKVINNITEIP